MKRTTILSALLALMSGIAHAQNLTNVFIGQIEIDPREVTIPPIKKIEIKQDSTLTIGQIHTVLKSAPQVNALYSIYSVDGDCIVPLSNVPQGGAIAIEEIPLATTGHYQLNVLANEDCILSLSTDDIDGTPTTESIPLATSVIYHLDIVVRGADDDDE